MLEEHWRSDADASAHRDEKESTRKALIRLVRKNVERRISSSSFSSRVFITDCCWVPTSASASTFVLCGLSNDCMSLLNIHNLSKIYLFQQQQQRATEAANAHSHGRGDRTRRRFLVHRQVSLDCCPRTATVGGKATLGMILHGFVQSCLLDITSAAELKKRQSGSGSKLLEVPRTCGDGCLSDTLFRFSPTGARAFALLSYETACDALRLPPVAMQPRYRVALFKLLVGGAARGELEVEQTWCEVVCPSAQSADKVVYLRHFGWWDDNSVLVVWSNGVVQWCHLLFPSPPFSGSLRAAGESYLLRGKMALQEEVRIAAATTCFAEAAQQPRQPLSTTTFEGSGLLTVVFGANCVTTFRVSLSQSAEEEPPHRRPHTENGNGAAGSVQIQLCPTQQSFFSEDVPVRSLTFTYLFSWVVIIVLESGAVLFLDAQTMELLLHNPLKRLWSDDDEAVNVVAKGCDACSAAPRANAKKLRGFSSYRPLSIGLVEHNSITLFKPQ